MSNAVALFRCFALGAGFGAPLAIALLLMAAPPLLHAAELQCADQPVQARGLGFHPSPELSSEAAKSEWLKKAQTVYSDARLETAKEPEMSCVNQGLYSNCMVSAVPCGTVPATPKPN